MYFLNIRPLCVLRLYASVMLNSWSTTLTDYIPHVGLRAPGGTRPASCSTCRLCRRLSFNSTYSTSWNLSANRNQYKKKTSFFFFKDSQSVESLFLLVCVFSFAVLQSPFMQHTSTLFQFHFSIASQLFFYLTLLCIFIVCTHSTK